MTCKLQDKCPVPICNLPEVLSPQQIKAITAFYDLNKKEVAFKIDIHESHLHSMLRAEHPIDSPAYKKLSDYIKKIIEEKIR